MNKSVVSSEIRNSADPLNVTGFPYPGRLQPCLRYENGVLSATFYLVTLGEPEDLQASRGSVPLFAVRFCVTAALVPTVHTR